MCASQINANAQLIMLSAFYTCTKFDFFYKDDKDTDENNEGKDKDEERNPRHDTYSSAI